MLLRMLILWVFPILRLHWEIVLMVHAHWHEWFLDEDFGGHGFPQLFINNVLYDNESAFMTIKDGEDATIITFR